MVPQSMARVRVLGLGLGLWGYRGTRNITELMAVLVGEVIDGIHEESCGFHI